MPVYDLAQCIGRTHSYQKITESICIIVRTMEKPFAILIDDIIGQHQVVIKKLGPEYAHIKGFTGSAILEDGKPSIILELGDLIKSKAHLRISTQTETRRTA
jgi:two-component system chemotaxis sensor kinase CheA